MEVELAGLVGRSLDRKAMYWFQKYRGPTLKSWAGMSWDKKPYRLSWSPDRSGTGPSRDSCRPLRAGLQFQMWVLRCTYESERERKRGKGRRVTPGKLGRVSHGNVKAVENLFSSGTMKEERRKIPQGAHPPVSTTISKLRDWRKNHLGHIM